jgi:hypothetical protein
LHFANRSQKFDAGSRIAKRKDSQKTITHELQDLASIALIGSAIASKYPFKISMTSSRDLKAARQ